MNKLPHPNLFEVTGNDNPSDKEMPPAPLPPQAARREEEFQWQPENEDIVVPEQHALAIYVNSWGQIVLRQEGEFREDDVWLRINIESLPQVIERLQQLLADNQR